MMQPFIKHCGVVAVLNRANVDTDQIIPKQFLKSIKRTGFEGGLFNDWRYRADGTPDPAFDLNAPEFKGASILVTGNNFGCGSSREHAVWAVRQYGFRVLIGPRRASGGQETPAFADIFRNNCVKNGVLTIELPESDVNDIIEHVRRYRRVEMTVDLENEHMTIENDAATTYHFTVDAGARNTLLKGLDEIAMTLEWNADITAFEAKHDTRMPRAVSAA